MSVKSQEITITKGIIGAVQIMHPECSLCRVSLQYLTNTAEWGGVDSGCWGIGSPRAEKARQTQT